jgi:hypothetical protein
METNYVVYFIDTNPDTGDNYPQIEVAYTELEQTAKVIVEHHKQFDLMENREYKYSLKVAEAKQLPEVKDWDEVIVNILSEFLLAYRSLTTPSHIYYPETINKIKNLLSTNKVVDVREETKQKFNQIFEDWGYGSNSDKEVCKRLILELFSPLLPSEQTPLKELSEEDNCECNMPSRGEDGYCQMCGKIVIPN